ncbi:MAG: glycosyl hydrolase 108 family protein [Peptostreptococcaceae bacterium]
MKGSRRISKLIFIISVLFIIIAGVASIGAVCTELYNMSTSRSCEIEDLPLPPLLTKSDMNKEIAEIVLSYEGDRVIRTSREYSKFGIGSKALASYNKSNKTKYTIEKLTKEQAVSITQFLMKTYRMDEIKDPRVRLIVFDTMFNAGVHGGGRIVQRAINFYNNIKHRDNIKVDGLVGSGTIRQLNNIEDVDLFIKLFIYQRIDSYKSYKEWDLYGRGWTLRITSISKYVLL